MCVCVFPAVSGGVGQAAIGGRGEGLPLEGEGLLGRTPPDPRAAPAGLPTKGGQGWTPR